MNITVIYVGNTKEKYFEQACVEYEKRISAFAHLRSIEIKEEKSSSAPSDAQIQSILRAEGGRIIEAIPKRAYKIALCVEGGQLTSEEFSAELHRVCVSGYSDIAFIIGGSWGLSAEVKKLCDRQLSFSKMTLPHRLMRVVLLEQIYRAQTIISNTRYHK